MKHSFTLTLALLLAACGSYASANWTIQGKAYQVDTLSHLLIGPGTTVTTLSLSGGSNLRLFYTETDLTNPYVKVRATNGSEKVGGRETLSKQSATYSTDSTIYFAGVNADFFDINKTDEPCGYLVVDGEFYTKGLSTGYQAIGFTDQNVPYLAETPLAQFSIDGKSLLVNAARGDNALVLYTERRGATTGTNTTGTEVVLAPAKKGTVLSAGKSMVLRVVDDPMIKSGNTAIEPGTYVLSGTGTMMSFVNNLKKGQTLTLYSTFTFDGEDRSGITQCVGGRPLILKNGEVLNTQTSLDHLTQNNPRTAVGYNADKTKLILLVVDGRTKNSVGVVSKQLADIMLNLGCSDAMNFDGGGSSELYTKDFGVLNSPSDGSERRVTDALFLASNAPVDNEVNMIRYVDQKQTVAQYSNFTPTFYGYNKYGVLISKSYQGAHLRCKDDLGRPVNDSSAIFCTEVGDHVFQAIVGTDTIDIPVTVVEGQISFSATSTFDDGYRGAILPITSKANGKTYTLNPAAFSWQSDDESIALVDEEGVIRGQSDGETTVHVTIGETTYDVAVRVQIPTQHSVNLISGTTAEDWTANQPGSVSPVFTVEGRQMQFSFTGGTSSMQSLTMQRKAEIWSLPDTFRVVVNPGELTVNAVILTFSSALGKTVSGAYRTTLTTGEDNLIEIPIASISSLDKRENFPLTFKGINMNTGKIAAGTDYNLSVKLLEAIYSAIEADVDGIAPVLTRQGEVPQLKVSGQQLLLSAPATGPTDIRVYTPAGQLVTVIQAAQGATSIALPSALRPGIYLLRISSGSASAGTKLLVP